MSNKKPTNIRRASMLSVAALATLTLSGCDGVPESASILIPEPAEFVPALIAFLIIWFVLAKFAWPMILKTLDDRQAKIQGDLDAAEHAHAEAQAEKKEYEQHLRRARQDGDEIVSAAKKEAEAELSGSVVDLSVEIAGKIIGNELTEDQQRDLAEKYLKEVGKPNDD